MESIQAPTAPTLPVSQALPSHVIDVMISAEQIQRRVRELGEAIDRDFPDPTEPLLLVGVLKGATLFLADLVRCIHRPIEFDFVAISSYGAATHTSGEVRILKDLDAAVAGKHVLIVEDIIDTGLTLRFSYLIESLRARHAKSVGVCVLLDKPSRRRVEVPVNYRGFEIPDRFVIGYGMDYAENYRGLNYIGILTINADSSATHLVAAETTQLVTGQTEE
jgi:hypoxanthine phosphoribosyltransferase